MHDLRTAKNFGLQVFAACAQLQHFADQQIHGVGAVAARGLWRVAVGQQKMVHAAHALLRIPQAGGNARTQHGGDEQVVARDKVLARQHFDGAALKMAVEVKQIGLARQPVGLLQHFSGAHTPFCRAA